ncbi:hypothetical protein WA158_007156 [Blastocystis sp. Blastoise]
MNSISFKSNLTKENITINNEKTNLVSTSTSESIINQPVINNIPTQISKSNELISKDSTDTSIQPIDSTKINSIIPETHSNIKIKNNADNDISKNTNININKISKPMADIPEYKTIINPLYNSSSPPQQYPLNNQYCNTIKLMLYPRGGMGNQMNLMAFMWYLSAIYKIPIYIPSDSIFNTILSIPELFSGQIVIFNEKNRKTITETQFLHINYQVTKDLLYMNDLEKEGNIMRDSILKDTFCNDYKYQIIHIYGHTPCYEMLFNHEKFKYYLYQYHFNPLIWNPVVTLDSHYQYMVPFLKVVKPKQNLLDEMYRIFPGYNTTRFLSVHGRFLGSLSDFPDDEQRITVCELDEFLNTINKTMIESHNQYFYLASDSTKFKRYAQKRFNTQCIVGNLTEIKNSNYERIYEKDSIDKLQAQLEAAAEYMILQYGNSCIASIRSSFSYQACTLLMKPFIIFGHRIHPPCYKSLSDIFIY